MGKETRGGGEEEATREEGGWGRKNGMGGPESRKGEGVEEGGKGRGRHEEEKRVGVGRKRRGEVRGVEV